MSCCTKKMVAGNFYCFTAADGSRQSLVNVPVLDCDGQFIAQSFHTPANYADNDYTAGIDVSAGTLEAGVCSVAPADIEFVQLCEELASGEVKSFLRRSVTNFDASGGVASLVVTDWELDKATAYTVVDEAKVAECDGCVPSGDQGLLTDISALFA